MDLTTKAKTINNIINNFLVKVKAVQKKQAMQADQEKIQAIEQKIKNL